jgi:hypothetical protein
MVDVIREYVQDDIGDSLHDLAIRQAVNACALKVRIAGFAALNDDTASEFRMASVLPAAAVA